MSAVRPPSEPPKGRHGGDAQSQSLSRSYGSILPTSLTHIVLSARGFSPRRPAAVVGTTDGTSQSTADGFSRVVESAPDAAPMAALCRVLGPLAGRTASRPEPKICPRQQETTTLAGALADVSVVPKGRRRLSLLRWLGGVGSGMSTRFPFTRWRVQDRLTRVRLPLTRNPRPRRPSKVSFE